MDDQLKAGLLGAISPSVAGIAAEKGKGWGTFGGGTLGGTVGALGGLMLSKGKPNLLRNVLLGTSLGGGVGSYIGHGPSKIASENYMFTPEQLEKLKAMGSTGLMAKMAAHDGYEVDETKSPEYQMVSLLGQKYFTKKAEQKQINLGISAMLKLES